MDFNIDPDKFRQKIEAHIEKSIELDKVNIAKTAIALRVIADHIRAICFTIADSQLPSNTGAGYVIRRILRRAVRYYYSYLNYKQPLLFQLVPVVAKQFEIVFPELQNQVEFVSKVVKEEEEGFIRTLGVGLFKLDIYLQMKEIEWNERLTSEGFGSATDLKENKIIPPQYAKKVAQEIKFIDGKFAFELNDTYGFPIDLTQLNC
ncbi:MAG: alanine--tRNA ligase-related protein [Segetibacter sp.]